MDPLLTRRERFLIPAAIVVAGIVLALTIFFVRSNRHAPVEGDLGKVASVSASDHVLGNPTAPVMVVEYADIDSPYAKQFQQNMEQLMTEYASTGKLAWVFRHFPLIDIHPHAGETAMAAECAASLGNSANFWRFIDLVQAAAPNENQFDPENYPAVATQLDIAPDALTSCVTKGTFGMRVANDAKNAVEAGAQGSPFVVILVSGQNPVSISGSVPYASLKKIIEESLVQTAP